MNEQLTHSTVDKLQRELLSLCKGQASSGMLKKVHALRLRIHAINPNAALFFGWAGPGDETAFDFHEGLSGRSDNKDPELPGLWDQSDLIGGETDCAVQQAELKPADFTIELIVTPMGGFAPITTHGVRVTHKPTGLTVSCDTERSQHRNKHIAFEKLRAMLATTSDPDKVPAQGSWVVFSNSIGIGVTAVGGSDVAWTRCERFGLLDGARSRAEDEDNAQVMAAARDLLDAADMALNTLLGCCVPAGGVDDRKTMLEAQQMLRKAIRKANGGP